MACSNGPKTISDGLVFAIGEDNGKINRKRLT